MNAIGGASGDMLLASLVDSGLDVMGLSSALASVVCRLLPCAR